MTTNTIAHFLLFLVVSCPSPGTGVTIVPPDKTKNETRSCRLELESLRPSIVPRDLKATSWEELATRHLIEWLPEQKTTTTRSGFTFTGAHMCTPIKFGTERQPVKSRLLWVTAITAAEQQDAHSARSENYLAGVRVMVLSALRNSPSLVPLVIYLGGKKDDCFVSWLTSRGAYVMVVNKLSFMASLPAHATDHSSASMANYGAFAILDMPRFWLKIWRDYGATLDKLRVDRAHALFTDADMLFTGDVTPAINMAVKPEQFPPRLMLVLSERWYPHVVREGFNTAAYYLNMSAFAEIVPSLLRYAIDKEWRFSEGLRDQGLFNDFFRAYSNSPGPHRHELEDKTIRPAELHPYFGWRPYGASALIPRIGESGKSQDSMRMQELFDGSIGRFGEDTPRITHFHGGKIWEMRCYLAEHAMTWEQGIAISAAGTAHCHGIKITSHKGFMVSSLSNPHIYISPCALLNYARLLDYFDQSLAETLPASSHGGKERQMFSPMQLKPPDQEDKEVYLWAIDRLRKQVIELGAKPDISLPE